LICVCPILQALHGDISQGQREKILQKFREDKFSVLVATDVAARGLDIPNVELVVHYDLPDQVEGFLHRYWSRLFAIVHKVKMQCRYCLSLFLILNIFCTMTCRTQQRAQQAICKGLPSQVFILFAVRLWKIKPK